MARVTYERGIRCKQCGKIHISANRFYPYVLCQGCGAHIGDFDLRKREMLVTNKAKIITVKVTHTLFSEIYEEVG